MVFSHRYHCTYTCHRAVRCLRFKCVDQRRSDAASRLNGERWEYDERLGRRAARRFQRSDGQLRRFHEWLCRFHEKVQIQSKRCQPACRLCRLHDKIADMVDKFDKWESEDLSDAELAYYIDVQARVSKLLIEASQSWRVADKKSVSEDSAIFSRVYVQKCIHSVY